MESISIRRRRRDGLIWFSISGWGVGGTVHGLNKGDEQLLRAFFFVLIVSYGKIKKLTILSLFSICLKLIFLVN